MTKDKPKIFEAQWNSFLGGVNLMKMRVDSLDKLKEISITIKKPVIKEKGAKRYFVIDGEAIYTFEK
ncbi:MAG: hypothetical protein ABH950_09585 [Candidatus Altiarchaeota archaeon]